MKSHVNQNTPIFNFISLILAEKNKQIKENILLGNLSLPKILFFPLNRINKFKTDIHEEFLQNLEREKQLLIVREEKEYLQKKISNTDNKILSIKKYDSIMNNRYKSLSSNISSKNSSPNYIPHKGKTKLIKLQNNNKKNSSYDNQITAVPNNFTVSKSQNICSLPSLSKDKKKYKIYQMDVKPIQIKVFRSNSKVNNHEKEEKLEKNAKAFIKRINNSKKNMLNIIKKRRDYYSLKLKNEIDKLEKQKKTREDEYFNDLESKQRDHWGLYENNNKPNKENEKNKGGKKYHYYSPAQNLKMLHNFTKDLLNFNSELYYNNNVPDLNQYQNLLVAFNNINNNYYFNDAVIENTSENENKQKIVSQINENTDERFQGYNNINNFIKNEEFKENTNTDVNISLSKQFTEGKNNISSFPGSNISNNNISSIDSSMRKNLYYFNEPRYENDINNKYNNDRIKQKLNLNK